MAESKRTCSVPECTKPHAANGYCGMHYNRMKRHGSTDVPPPSGPTMEQRFWAKVNKNGSVPTRAPHLGPCWEWTGAKSNAGYAKFYIDGHYLGSHRVSYEMHTGPIPAGHEVDHECHNPGCVNPRHLRSATPKQNAEYRSGASAVSTTGIRGVRWHKRAKVYEGYVTDAGHQIYVGSFPTLAEADAAVRAKRAELFTFPEVV